MTPDRDANRRERSSDGRRLTVARPGGGGMIGLALFVAVGCLVAAGCHDAAPTTTSDAGACTVGAATSATGEVTDGCALLTRDTSACRDARAAAGLDGFWLDFSCDVTLTVSGGNVIVATTDVPDYPSNYFSPSDPCRVATPSDRMQNPNTIAPQHASLTIPRTPAGASQAMGLGAVGVAVNGVEIFDDQAAPGDSIFQEAVTFDACEGHPTMTGTYHYHAEPYAISYDDARFIGVLRDGYAVYGRRDADGSVPTLDAAGGHVAVPPGGTTAVYHYHVNAQTDPQSGSTQWFLTTGKYQGAPGACTGCM